MRFCLSETWATCRRTAIPVASTMSMLRTSAVWMPGHHDGMTFPQVAADAGGPRSVADALARGMEARVATLDAAMGQVTRVAYTRWTVGDGVQMVAARPHTMGGPSLSCRPYLSKTDGTTAWRRRPARLAGGRGAGRRAHDLGGTQRPVWFGGFERIALGVTFILMKGTGETQISARPWSRPPPRDGTWPGRGAHAPPPAWGRRRTAGLLGSAKVINAARVPRIQRDGRRHHVELHVSDEGITAFAVEVCDGDSVRVAL